MLLTKTVKVKWNNTNKKWYISKGYIFTKCREFLEVNVEDLPANSMVKVDVKCDNCNHIRKNQYWQSYKKCEKENGKYYCRTCSMKLFGGEKLSKTLLKKNGKSFELWCIENSHQNILDRWDYELNDKLPIEIGYSTHKNFYFKCPQGIHKSELKNINDFTNGHNRTLDCKACNSFAQWGIDNLGENFLKKYWDYEKNNELGIDPWILSKNTSRIKVWIKCQEKDYHGSYYTTVSRFTLQSQRCPYCANKNGKVHLLDSIGKMYPQVLNIWSSKNKKSAYEYSYGSDEKVFWKCECGKHEDYLRKIGVSHRFDFRCPECSRERDESFLQEKVRLYVESLDYTILHENKCTIVPKNPKTKMSLPFDNEIKELKLIIEVMGGQHYYIDKIFNRRKSIKNGSTPKYELHYQQLKDRYKRIYAKSKGYNYLEIPYWTDNKKEEWKKLIDNKIKEMKIA